MSKNERGFPIGIGILGLGTTLTISFWIYTIQESGHYTFWRWPGYLGIFLILIGLLLVVIYFSSDTEGDSQHQQSQTSGNFSTNIQVGRDLNMRNTENE